MGGRARAGGLPGLLLALAALLAPAPGLRPEAAALVGCGSSRWVGLLGGRPSPTRAGAESAARALAIGDIAAVRTAAEALGRRWPARRETAGTSCSAPPARSPAPPT
jgi:hypothetical protein